MFRSNAPATRPGEVTRHAHGGSKAALAASGPSATYPFRLNFYERPPLEEVTIEQFEAWALDRLRVLADIEALLTRGRPTDEISKLIGPRLKQYLPLSSNTAVNQPLDDERRKDHIGHYVLRLAFCRTQELRTRFIKAENTLFRIRFDTDAADERQRFLETLNFDSHPVSSELKNLRRKELLAVAPYLSKTFDSETYIRVHWTKVCDLVEKRRVYLEKGMAYVPMSQQISLVQAEFSSRLDKALEMTARALPRLDEDDRLMPVLDHLSMGFMAGISSEYNYSPDAANGEHITAGMVDALVSRHAPACMRNLHGTLKANKHLKHFGRLQFNLFLKGIGVSIEEALIFWRKSFSNMDGDKFNKEHKYNIRHGYGLEGGRKNYAPKDCQRILTQDQPGTQDSHGCPFRHFAAPALQHLLLTSYGISDPVSIKEILDATKTQHYHVACTRVFEITHAKRFEHLVKKGDGLGNGESVSHPNRYFEKSRELEKLAKGEIEAKQNDPQAAGAKIEGEEEDLMSIDP